MRPMRPLQPLRFIGLAAALAALPARGLPAAEPGAGAPPATPPTLATAPVQLRTVPREYRLDGVVEAVNRSTVSAQTQGQVAEVLFDVDDTVEQGAVVARLKDTEQRARLAQAQADLKSAAARLAQARDEHARVQGLFGKKNVSASAMDQATAELASAQAALDAADARLAQAREQLDYTQIRAPYSGIVTDRHVQVGEMASPGTPIMTGLSLDQLRVSAQVPQSLMPAVRQGGRALVYLPDGRVLEGRAITVFPYADPGSNSFRVRVDLPAGAAAGAAAGAPRVLFPGMLVKTGFAVGEKRELAVPKSAVVQRSEVTGVYTVADGDRVHFRQIRLGRDLGDDMAVLAGLAAGERVALDPTVALARLKDQAPRRPTPEQVPEQVPDRVPDRVPNGGAAHD